MRLAKDEAIGLVIAALIGGSALGLYVYRQLDARTPTATAAKVDPHPQGPRDEFGEQLEQAFREDGVAAVVYTEGTALHVRWTACSKPMLKKLLDKKDDALTRNLRKLSGLSAARLKQLGFTKLVCDDTAKRVVTEKL